MMNDWIGPLLFGLLIAYMLYNRFVGKASSADARSMVAAGARLVDVRSPGEFAGGHITGAINIPVDQLPNRIAEIGPPDTAVVLYCASGMRSARAAAVLKAKGFAKVADIGPMSRW